MKTFLKISFILSSVIALGVVALFIAPLPQFEKDTPRPTFWDYPRVSEAKIKFEYLDSGFLDIQIEHPELKGVTPAMISWWYKHLASGRYKIQGVEYDFYHLFHLSEHGKTSVVSPAADGSMTMDKGAIVYRQECFGPHFSKGKGLIEEFSEQGFVVSPVLGPLKLGRIEHSFTATENGTIYRVKTLLGLDAPLIGPLINLYIRKKQFPPDVVKEWVRHQVEEVGSLVHYLPQIYQEQAKR